MGKAKHVGGTKARSKRAAGRGGARKAAVLARGSAAGDPGLWSKTLRDALRRLEAPDDAVRAFYAALIDDATALRDGGHQSPVELVDECLRIVPAAARYFARGGDLAGYGPLRLGYLGALSIVLVDSYAARNVALRARLGATEKRVDAVGGVHHSRADLVTILENVLGKVPTPERASVERAAAAVDKRHDTAVTTLANLVTEASGLLARHAHGTPARAAYEDAGLTDALLAEARALVAGAESERDAQAERDDVLGLSSRAFKVLEGRVAYELGALARAYANAKRHGRNVPDLSLHHAHAAGATDAPPAAGGVTGAPSSATPGS